MQRLLQVLFWSVIPAAFVGPGTVTTAASSGARFEYALLWALVFSTLATFVLQEASARLAIVSGQPLAAAIHRQFRDSRAWVLIAALVVGAIVVGCAAFQVGNVLGAVAGAELAVPAPPRLVTLAVGLAAALLLYRGSPRTVARVLGAVVAVMGVTFLATAVLVRPAALAVAQGAAWPTLPPGSSLLVLGLVGTTVVPYNLFLGSRFAVGQDLGAARFGLAVAVGLGGLISMGILIVGTAVTGPLTYAGLAAALSSQLGRVAGSFFAVGLFAAGFSSAVTSPLAAAITARGLVGGEGDARWHERSWRFAAVWLGVLLTGVGFGLTHVQPIPAIVLAQAANGILLPFLAVFLLLAVNDPRIMGQRLNGRVSNVCMSLVVGVCFVLGAVKTMQAVAAALGAGAPGERTLLTVAILIALGCAAPLVVLVRSRRLAAREARQPDAPALAKGPPRG